MGGFGLFVEFHWEGSAINGATPSRFRSFRHKQIVCEEKIGGEARQKYCQWSNFHVLSRLMESKLSLGCDLGHVKATINFCVSCICPKDLTHK